MLPRLRSSSLLPAVYCRSPDWSLAAAVHTPADFLSPAELPCSSAALAALNRIFFSGGSFTERTSTYPSLASHFPWEPQHQAAAAGSRAANIVVTDVLGRHTCTWWISTWPSVSRRGINNTANSILHVYYRPACGGRGGVYVSCLIHKPWLKAALSAKQNAVIYRSCSRGLEAVFYEGYLLKPLTEELHGAVMKKRQN